MQPVSVVVTNSSSTAAASLAESLGKKFGVVSVSGSGDELRSAIRNNRPAIAVVDLELVPLAEVKQLCREFSQVPVVCTHRLADESIWARALAAGAADCCYPEEVVTAAERSLSPMAKSHAA